MYQISKENKNLIAVIGTLVLLVSHSIYPSFSYFLKMFGIVIPSFMMVIYAVPMILVIIVLFIGETSGSQIIALVMVYFFYYINYSMTVYKAKKYFKNTDITALLLFYVPVAILLAAIVYDWSPLFNNKWVLFFLDFIIIFSFLAKKNGFDDTNYMSFSYGLLPIWGMLFIAAFYYKKNIQWIFLILGLYSGVVYGARGPLAWMVILMVCTWCFCAYRELQNPKYLLMLIVMILVVVVFVQVILPLLLKSEGAESSYILRRINQGSVGESKGRDEIYIVAKKELSKFNLKPYGMFYDRTILPQNLYAHNIVYEIFLDYGWIMGTVMVLAIILFVLFPVFKQKNDGLLYYYCFICTIFMRYFLSGSIFDEGQFFVFLGIIFSMCKHNYLVDVIKPYD